MSAARGPLAGVRAVVGLAVRVLPTTERARYRAELLADLHHLRRVDQLGYAIAVLSRAPALRAALNGGTVAAPARRVPLLRCRVFRWHDFAVRSTSDGGRYQQCRLCGTDRGPISNLPTTSPPQRGPL